MIIYTKGKENFEKLLNGVEHVNSLIAPTMGVNGGYVLYQTVDNKAHSVNDGATIATYAGDLDDPVERMGANLVIEASRKASRRSGDGTSLTVLLYYNLLKQTIEKYEDNSDKIKLSSTLEKDLETIKKVILDKHLIKFDGLSQEEKDKMIYNIAKTSAKDSKMAEAIQKCFNSAGDYGMVNVTTYLGESKFDIFSQNGFIFYTGLVHGGFNNTETGISLKKPILILVDSDLNLLNDNTMALFKKVSNFPGNKVIIANKFGGAVVDKVLSINSQNPNEKIFLVQNPGFDHIDKTNTLKDLGVYLGGLEVFKVEQAQVRDIPNKEIKEYSQNKNTVMVQVDSVDSDEKTNLIEQLTKIKTSDKTQEKDKAIATERLARLQGGIHTLEIYGQTEFELKDKLERADDAIRAVMSMKRYGFVVGGGTVFAKIAMKEKLIAEIWKEVLTAPIRQLNNNSGLATTEEELEEIANSDNLGYNLKFLEDNTSSKMINLKELGVFDSVETILVALEMAVNDVKVLLKTTASITRN